MIYPKSTLYTLFYISRFVHAVRSAAFWLNKMSLISPAFSALWHIAPIALTHSPSKQHHFQAHQKDRPLRFVAVNTLPI